MNDSRDIGYALFALGFGVWGFFHGLGVMRKKMLIESIPASTVRGLALGLVELNGKAKYPKTFASPLTATECVFYRYTVERLESSGRSSRWVLIAQGDSVDSPFFLDDSTGNVMIMPQGAEFIMPADYTITTSFGSGLPNNLVNFMEKDGLQYKGLFGNYTLRFNEWYIKPDEPVFVVGTAQNNTIQQENDVDVIIAKANDGQIFIVSDQSQTEVVKGYSWQAFCGVWGGSALSLAMLAYLLYRFGVWARF